MTTIRRRIIRATVTNDDSNAALTVRQLKSLAKDRLSLRRWFSRLKRAFHAIERLQARINRHERKLPQR